MRNLKMMYQCVSSWESAETVWKGAVDENHFLLPTADEVWESVLVNFGICTISAC